MFMTAPAGAAEPSRADRYLQAEQQLWKRYGLTPSERFIALDRPSVRLRVVEVGSGPPILAVPGTGGTGPYWAALVDRLPNYRFLLLDRPGWGLSSPVRYTAGSYRETAATILDGVLRALQVPRAGVLGASIGGLWALSLAQRFPERVSSAVILGGAPILPTLQAPPFIRLLASPIGGIIARLPMPRRALEGQLRGLGHGSTMDAGGLPEEFYAWRMAFDRLTPSMRHEREMVRAIVSVRGWRPGVMFTGQELGEFRVPVLMVHGSSDPVGTDEFWRHALADQLPAARLEVIAESGHVPWLDDPERVATLVEQALSASGEGPGS